MGYPFLSLEKKSKQNFNLLCAQIIFTAHIINKNYTELEKRKKYIQKTLQNSSFFTKGDELCEILSEILEAKLTLLKD